MLRTLVLLHFLKSLLSCKDFIKKRMCSSLLLGYFDAVNDQFCSRRLNTFLSNPTKDGMLGKRFDMLWVIEVALFISGNNKGVSCFFILILPFFSSL